MADIVPDGARFIEGTYANAAGSRAYRLFIPSGYDGQASPLVVMLHGCTQSPEDFAAGTRMNFIAEEQTCFVAYPAQRADANQAKCWNWFRPGDQQRGGGEPSLIAGITRQIMRDHSVDPERVYVAGSRGRRGHGIDVRRSVCSDRHSSGLACGAASDLPSALMAMKQGGGPEAMPSDGPPVPTIIPRRSRHHGAFEKRRSDRPTVDRRDEHNGEGAARTGAGRACLHPHGPYRPREPRNPRTLGDPRSRTRTVWRQPRRLLHRSGRTGCNEADAALLPRAFAPPVRNGYMTMVTGKTFPRVFAPCTGRNLDSLPGCWTRDLVRPRAISRQTPASAARYPCRAQQRYWQNRAAHQATAIAPLDHPLSSVLVPRRNWEK
ncbi:hypothetical protein JQ615_19805 [Bradyrhizobium jicamae]|uniref:PHB depolymerase family esterase n=1 Tax=Bradyrhizobium jicamae TaxID=280332 RepID=A0ABS5FLU4_9BRAD|nr:hypothetical protein [Bradyrhizobium jicamae]